MQEQDKACEFLSADEYGVNVEQRLNDGEENE
jgi:hypothetical protein